MRGEICILANELVNQNVDKTMIFYMIYLCKLWAMGGVRNTKLCRKLHMFIYYVKFNPIFSSSSNLLGKCKYK